MKLAVVSDIHANLEAFQRVIEDIELHHVDRIVSLGDNVGYGPQPEEVLALLSARAIPSVMGNHELGLSDPSTLSWFNPETRRSLEITRRLLSETSLQSIGTLPATLTLGRALCVHGCPLDSITTYLFQASDEELHPFFRESRYDVCFVGHTHVLDLVTSDGERIERNGLRPGTFLARDGRKRIVNVGSVGQPRDGDNRAKYLLWDEDSKRMEVRAVPYDIGKTAARILELGFPEFNAHRLW